jgi:hypothetical protein
LVAEVPLTSKPTSVSATARFMCGALVAPEDAVALTVNLTVAPPAGTVRYVPTNPVPDNVGVADCSTRLLPVSVV